MNLDFHIVRGCLPVVPALFLAAVAQAAPEAPVPAKIRFNRDVRPILSDNCYQCHGFDAKERKADRRIDNREGALADNDGVKAIVPGKLAESDAWARIISDDDDDVMPPPKSGKKLSDRDREIIKRWIEQGAEYENHWAYEKPEKQAIPAGRDPIDALVQQRLAEQGLTSSQEADRRTLFRRLSFDLLGLPPKAEDVEAFINDPAPDAYARLVEKLLSSPHYGERMALPWLDVVRYADTIGYHSDNPRNVWPYRDYVIKSFNDNKRFDQFTREQIAGDLLPDSTKEQKVGSAFNRLLLSTEEGGAQAKDYEARMLTDRVRAIGSAWLGATIGCAQCHDHKFDPITSRDFYSLGAFFADIKEPIIGRREDGMFVTTPEQDAKLAEYEAKTAALQARLDQVTPELEVAQRDWEAGLRSASSSEPAWSILHPEKLESEKEAVLTLETGEVIRATPPNGGKDVYKVTVKTALRDVTGLRLEVLKSSRLPSQGPGNSGGGNFVLTEFSIDVGGQPAPLREATATYEQQGYPAKATIDGVVKKRDNGWAVRGKTGADNAIYFELAKPLGGEGEKTLTLTLRHDYGDNHTIGKFRISATGSKGPIRAPGVTTGLPKEVVEAMALPLVFRTPAQAQTIAKHYRSIAPLLEPVRTELETAKKQKEEFEKALPRCLVSTASDKARMVRILPRGNWMDETGEVVQPALPHFLPQPQTGDRKLTRLDLAEWLISRENPLTARVFVNRLWKQFFGIGLSKVLDDFGAQGEPPVNPELLDWLACEFMDSGWDVKHVVRLIVSSHTYRQVSTASKELQTRDPYNRELARQSRWRLDAELVRDNALSVVGLLVPKIGGPSVKPYQPAGYWENLNFPTREYDADKDENQYRRGLYTHWQRSFLHPSLLAFDAPSREECAADRVRSNIPQQALVLLNDPTYVEAARVLAARTLRECSGDAPVRLGWAFRQTLQREPRPDEVATLTQLLEKHLREFRADATQAEGILKVGLAPLPENTDKAELAAWTSVARVILNLHETITRS
ncbi:PSD1 and planctomycete cytochrome C domain-containing protein [Verrucomicrobiota bacterium sgz303538]